MISLYFPSKLPARRLGSSWGPMATCRLLVVVTTHPRGASYDTNIQPLNSSTTGSDRCVINFQLLSFSLASSDFSFEVYLYLANNFFVFCFKITRCLICIHCIHSAAQHTAEATEWMKFRGLGIYLEILMISPSAEFLQYV